MKAPFAYFGGKSRIALCGYEGEHEMPPEWDCAVWKAAGGYSMQGDGQGKRNRLRERIWFSPACVKPELTLFEKGAL